MNNVITQYYMCPMKCEGNKVYDNPGDCPVCNMHLVPLEENNKNSVHIHTEHDHGHRHESHLTGK
jgi:Cu+-exporting ATPase